MHTSWHFFIIDQKKKTLFESSVIVNYFLNNFIFERVDYTVGLDSFVL
jgi:hypothetical protein